MASLDVEMVLSLVDKASAPAKGILGRIFGGASKAGGAVADQIDGAGISARAANGAMVALNRSIATFAAGAGAYVGFRSMIGGAVEFEAAFADVQKKVSASPAEFAKLQEQIKQIARETPLAAAEIASLVAQAGQFGIANRDLTRFAQLGSKASVAFEMGATEAADSLSQMKNALKLNMDELEAYADAINMVADSTGSSEQQLIDFVLRTGPGAMAAGLDPKDLLAIGSALTEVGISSQRAGTGVNGMIAKMAALTNRKTTVKILDKIAGKGYSEKLQKKFFDTPRDALLDLMKITREMARPDRARLFIDLFGLETQDEAMAFAGQVDKVVETLDRLGDASNYAGSVAKTFQLFSETTEQQWKRFTNNVSLASSALGAKMLPAINSSLEYLNTFFATAEGRINVIDRLKNSFGGFVTGLGYKGGSTAFFSDVAGWLQTIRDLIFGIEGDDKNGEGGGRIFERWRQIGQQLKDSPIETIFNSIVNANVGELGGALAAGAVGLGAMSLAGRLALAPLRGVLGVMKAIVKAAYLLSGLRTAKWLLDLAGGFSGGRKTPAAPSLPSGGKGGALAWLAGAVGRAAPLLSTLLLSGDTPNGSWKDDPRSATYLANQRIARSRAGIGERERDTSLPGLADDAARAASLDAFLSGPITVQPSGVQEVRVTNPTPPPPAPVVNVTVNATTNASPAEIGAAAGNALSEAMRASYGDGAY